MDWRLSNYQNGMSDPESLAILCFLMAIELHFGVSRMLMETGIAVLALPNGQKVRNFVLVQSCVGRKMAITLAQTFCYWCPSI